MGSFSQSNLCLTWLIILYCVLSPLGAVEKAYGSKWESHFHQRIRERSAVKCDPQTRYRRPDGSCNNVNRPSWGASVTVFERILGNKYDDKINSPRTKGVSGQALPSPREVSLKVHNASPDKSSVTLMVMQWGQFIDHDVTLTPKSTDILGDTDKCPCGSERSNSNCFPISVPDGDEHFRLRQCLQFTRSTSVQAADDCSKGRNIRQQINSLTAFLDGSNLYGNSQEELDKFRVAGGKLLMARDGQYLAQGADDTCTREKYRGHFCFMAGDSRVNENPGLTTLMTMMTRQHNQFADYFKMNTEWDDDTIFQETRKIMEALIQKITYKEFLPVVLSRRYLNMYRLDKSYYRYKSNVNPSILNSFATAAFRFGHSLIPDYMFLNHSINSANRKCQRQELHELKQLYHDHGDPHNYNPHDNNNNNNYNYPESSLSRGKRVATSNNNNNNRMRRMKRSYYGAAADEADYNDGENSDSSPNPKYWLLSENLAVWDSFFTPTKVFESFDQLTTTITTDKSMASDRHFSDSVRNHLMRLQEDDPSDLVALNIQRGRDHGLPSYNEFRKRCRLPRVTSLHQLFGGNRDAVSVYSSIEDVDLFTGAMSEKPVRGGLVGQTFSCLIALQFHNLKYGDRFFYLNHKGKGLRRDQIQEVEKMTLSKLMCDNSGMKTMQKNAFLPKSAKNPEVCCHQMPVIDLSKWTRYSQRQLKT